MPSHKIGPICQAAVGAPFRAMAKPDVAEDRTRSPVPQPCTLPGERDHNETLLTCKSNWPRFRLALQKSNWLYRYISFFITATHTTQNLTYCRDDHWVSWVCCELVDELRWGDQPIPSTWGLLNVHRVHSPVWKSGPASHAQGHLGSVW